MRDATWLWVCSIPFWLLLAGAVVVAVTEDPSPVRFAATAAGGAAMSGALIGLVRLVGRSNRRAAARDQADARRAQVRAWTVIFAAAAAVAAGAGVAAAVGAGGGAVALAGAAALVMAGAMVAVWRRTSGRV